MAPPAHAARPYIAVGEAQVKKTVVAIPKIRVLDPTFNGAGDAIRETMVNDLSFMDSFRVLDQSAYIENASTSGIIQGSFKYPDWSSIGSDFLVKTKVTLDPGKALVLEAHLFNITESKEVLSKIYRSTPGQVRTMAHQLANDIVQNVTGLPGIFLTKIAMSCDRTGKKEIYMMNYDGTEVKQVTHHRSLAIGPAWSPDATKIAYSLMTRHKNNIKNIDVFEFNLVNNTIKMISNRRGINSGPAYSPDGQNLALTLSFGENSELYRLNLRSGKITHLTHSFGVDVDPNWSPDGKYIAFVSTRTGLSMIHRMNADGSNAQRLTFAGKYNATPSWSLQNNKIAFAGWLEGLFDIFIMNPDGSNIERLTKNQGNNEDPYFSPDGNFVTFSSNRTGQKNIYVMNIDGSFVRRLTYGLGNCVSPKWSNPPTVATPSR